VERRAALGAARMSFLYRKDANDATILRKKDAVDGL
jgi:hypothetical protein